MTRSADNPSGIEMLAAVLVFCLYLAMLAALAYYVIMPAVPYMYRTFAFLSELLP